MNDKKVIYGSLYELVGKAIVKIVDYMKSNGLEILDLSDKNGRREYCLDDNQPVMVKDKAIDAVMFEPFEYGYSLKYIISEKAETANADFKKLSENKNLWTSFSLLNFYDQVALVLLAIAIEQHSPRKAQQ